MPAAVQTLFKEFFEILFVHKSQNFESFHQALPPIFRGPMLMGWHSFPHDPKFSHLNALWLIYPNARACICMVGMSIWISSWMGSSFQDKWTLKWWNGSHNDAAVIENVALPRFGRPHLEIQHIWFWISDYHDSSIICKVLPIHHIRWNSCPCPNFFWWSYQAPKLFRLIIWPQKQLKVHTELWLIKLFGIHITCLAWVALAFLCD